MGETTTESDLADPATFHMADVWEAVSDRIGERVALVCGDDQRTYAELEDRSNRIAHLLRDAGVGPGDHVGVHLPNCIEYLEVMLAAYKLRAVPINVNFRYVADELRYLFRDAGIVALIHHVDYDEAVDAVVDEVPTLRARWSVGEGGTLEEAIAGVDGGRDFGPRSNDDLYIIYTGGTTGMPKGVVWRQQDAFYACIGGGDPMRLQGPATEPGELVERIIDFEFSAYPVAPLIHAAAQWTSLSWLFCGARVVLHPGSFDARRVWETAEREQVATMVIVGDAMARPLVDEWDRSGPYDLGAMFALGSGGAPLSPHLKARLAEILPHVMITDGFGSSETGAQGAQRFEAGSAGGPTRFEHLGGGTTVLDDDLREVAPGSGVVGRVARTGYIPLRYHNDPDKTAATFVEVGGTRWVLTGDAATVAEDGSITLLGRGTVSINTGGEKVFPEEVESALKAHPSVYDAVVVGVPDERWGERVCAVVQPTAGATPTLEELQEHCRESVAGYKVPRELVLVEEVVRSPVGKADYPWARRTALEAVGDG